MVSSVPTSKTELLAAIETTFTKVYQTLSTIPCKHTGQTYLEGHRKGTHMSVHNLLAYLVGWNELVLKWLKQDQLKQAIDFPETGYQWNQLGLLAEKFYKDYETIPYPQLLDYFKVVKQQLVEAINKLTNQQLYQVAWYNQWTKGRMIQFNSSSPYKNAYSRLRKWLKTHNET